MFEGVRISFHHANPDAGNESFLLRIDGESDETSCILVDTGHGVDLDDLLQPSDRLAAICLTHAHLDHYAELAAAHRHDAPILTSPATAAVLDDIFDVAGVEYDVKMTDDVADAITPVDDWTDVASGIDVHPIPAGHVPGAVGFLVRVTDGDQSHHILATGDFTFRRAGSYPGFDAEGFVDIDVLFLTAATNDTFEASLTDALGTALEYAHGGAPTLVTTSGLVGVHVAYLLSALSDEYELRVPIRVVGQVAKLYEAFDYGCRDVETIPYFQNTAECLEPGAITIAGPEIPSEQSSGRLFGVLRENSNACVVQLVGSGANPLLDGKCTIHDYELINHPTAETLVDLHNALEPTQTIITHRHGGAQGAFNDLSGVVWGTGDTDEHTLFDGRRWQLPYWMSGKSVSQSNGRSVQQLAGADLLASFSVPELDRHDEPDLEAEGIDLDRIETLLHQGPEVSTSPDAPNRHDEQRDETDSRVDSIIMTADSTNTTDSDDSTDNPRPSTGLIRTTGADLSEELDPWLQTALEDGSLTKEDLTAVLAAQERHAERELESDNTTEEASECNSTTTLENGNSEADHTEEEILESTDESKDVAVATEDDSEEGLADDRSTGIAETENAEDIEQDESPTHESTIAETDNSGSQVEESEAAIVLDLNPLAVALAKRTVDQRHDDDAGVESIDEAIVEAVDRYIVALLAGEASGTEAERFSIDVDGSETVEQVLEDVIRTDNRFESTSALVSEGITSVLSDDSSEPRKIRGLGVYRRHLHAIETNETYVFDDTEEIIETAITWYVRDR